MTAVGWRDVSFQNSSGSFLMGLPFKKVAPATGATIKMHWNDRRLYINPAGTLAALTVRMPGGQGDRDEVQLYFNQAITAFTLQDYTGHPVAGAPTTVTAGSDYNFSVEPVTLTWLLKDPAGGALRARAAASAAAPAPAPA